MLGTWRPGVIHCHVYIVWCLSVRFDACSGAFECCTMQKLHAFTCQAVCFPGIAGKASPQQIRKAHASDKPCFWMHLVNSFERFFFTQAAS